MNARIQPFLNVARREFVRHRREPSEEVADRLYDALKGVDERLGIEISDDSDEPREAIFTAFSASDAFPLIRAIVAALDASQIPGWQFIALKPPRGFDFTLTVGDQELRAATIRFAPIPEIENGIRLVVDPHVVEVFADDPDGNEELAWLVVESGIGEELASRLRQIEFVDARGQVPSLPIAALKDYVAGLAEEV